MPVTLLVLTLFAVFPVTISTPEVQTPDGPAAVWLVEVPLERVTARTVAADPRDPDGPGVFQTRLWPVQRIAKREGAWLAVNGDFFSAPPVSVLGRQERWVHGNRARVVGWGLTDGELWGEPLPQDGERVTLWLSGDRATIGTDRPAWAEQAVSGSTRLLTAGRTVAPDSPTRHPRTTAGLSGDGRTLYLLIADGRRPGHSVGLTLAEAATLLKHAGATDALNLDGGGSTTLVAARRLLNRPSDGGTFTPPLSIPRPVANALLLSPRPPLKGR